MRRVTQRIYIAHRGRGSASGDTEGAVTFSGYFAAVPGGKADVGFSVVNGVVQTTTPPGNRDLEPFDYPTGPFGLGEGGHGWAGAPLISAPYIGRAGLETFDTYALGPVTDLNAGTGWAAAPLIAAY